jgi:hypothetical protein
MPESRRKTVVSGNLERVSVGRGLLEDLRVPFAEPFWDVVQAWRPPP